jgi:hypothetical protein
MRFFVRSANALDVACVGAVVGDRLEQSNTTATGVGDRLALAWNVSRQVWIALDSRGVPAALFGAVPMEDDASTGQLWTLFLAAFEKDHEDGRAVFSLVLHEMLREFDRLETMVDARREWVLGMLQSVGFIIDPVVPRYPGDRCHRVWLEGKPQSPVHEN